MQEHDDELFAAALRIAETAARTAAQHPSQGGGGVHVHDGTAVNVGNVVIGSQTIHYPAAPPQQKGR